ncbi:helix-turn-helix domain-containing protein [Streptomyces sp. NPDC091280]|uniref:helix-turn-helix domain-containing protein n=1 Tax=Streptomyces sp. NPDC091280 TaxID=3365984 RepID=UPI0037FBA2F9
MSTAGHNQDPARVRRRRVEAGLSQVSLARRVGVTKGHLSLVESGGRGASPELLGRLANALSCEIADLMPPLEREMAGSTA